MSLAELAAAQVETHDDTKAYSTENSGLVVAEVKLDDFFLLRNVSTGRPRPVVLTSCRRAIFEIIHRTTLKLDVELH